MTASKTSAVKPALRDFNDYPDSAMIRPQVAKDLLGISIATLWRLIRSKKLKAHRLTERTTAITAGDLRAFMNQQADVEG